MAKKIAVVGDKVLGKEKTLGLDVGSENIKWIIYSESARKPTIFEWGIKSSPSEIIRNGSVNDSESLEKSIKEILSDTDIKLNRGSLTLSCPEMVFRSVEIPKINKKELGKFLDYEFEKILPVSASNYITDFQITQEFEKDGNKFYQVMLAAIPANIIEGYIKVLENLNIFPIVVDFQGNSASYLINKQSPNIKEKNYSIVDIGSTTTSITIVEKGFPAFTRLIHNTSDELISAVNNSMGFSFKGNETTLSDVLLEEIPFIMPAIEKLSNDIYRTIEFYQTNNHKAISNLILIGGGSKIKNLDKYLSQQLNIKLIQLEKENSINFRKEFPLNNLPLFANVLGLAFRGER